MKTSTFRPLLRAHQAGCAALFFLLLGFGGGLFAQSQAIDGTIEGVVDARDGSRIPNATVKAVNKGTGLERSTRTDEGGRYRLNLLPPGVYSVSVESPGFAAISRPSLELRAGQTVTAEFQMAVGEVATTIDVTGEIPVVEVGRTVRANTYDERVVRNLPTAGRSLMDFFVVQPGVNAPPISTGGSGTGTASTVFGGLGFRQMNVDGVSNNLQGGARNLVISQESIQEFQVVTSFSAEFGRVAGGLQNAFSRSGTNDLHGSGFLFTRNKVLSARPYLLAPTAPTPNFFRYNFGGTIAGPIKRDRAFFFATYERWMQDNPVVSTIRVDDARRLGIPQENVGSWITGFRAHTLTAKADWQISQKNRLSTRYNFYYDRESPLGGGQNTREQASRFDEEPNSITSQLVTSFSPTLLNELRFHFANRPIRNGVLNPLAPNVSIQGFGTFNGNQDGDFSSLEQGFQIIENVTKNVGRHSFKAGFDLLPVSFKERTRNLNGQFVFAGLNAVAGVRPAVTPIDQFLFADRAVTDPATGRPYTYTRYTQAIGAEFFTARVINQGYFFQDDIRVTERLKVNLGLRYELFWRPQGNANPLLPQTGRIPQDKNNWAPRLGIAYDPFGKGKTVIRAGYGLYYNTTVAQTFNTYLRGNGAAVLNANVTPDLPGAPAFTRSQVLRLTSGTLVSDVRLFADRFDDPKAQNYFVTFEQQFFSSNAIAVTYQGTRGANMPYSTVENISQSGTLADGRRRWLTAQRPDPRFGLFFVARSEGYQNYNGMVITYTRRFDRGLALQASYHYSKTDGIGYTNAANAFTGFGILSSASDPQNAQIDRGHGDWDMRHRFTLTGVWEPKLRSLTGAASALLNGWQIAPRLITNTGFAYTATTGQDNNGDSVFNDRPVGIAYNSFNLPSFFALDMRLTRNFRIGERSRVELMAEAFNMTNRLNATNVNRVWGPNATPNANFSLPTSAETPRQFQLAVRYSF